MTTIEEIARRLKLLCEQLRFVEAYETLYSTDAVSIDPMNKEHGELKGLEALIESEKKFLARTNVHRFVASDPLIAGSYISFRFFMDITMDMVPAGRAAEQRGRGGGRGPHLPAVLAGKAGGAHGEAADRRLGLAAHRHTAAGRMPGAAVQRARGQRGTRRAALHLAPGRPVPGRPPCRDHLGHRPGAAE